MSKMKVIKRDGRIEEFNIEKIKKSIEKASNGIISNDLIDKMCNSLNLYLSNGISYNPFDKSIKENSITVENIEKYVEEEISYMGYPEISNSHKKYRLNRSKIRETKSDLMYTLTKIGIETDRDNGNVGNNFSAKLLRIASESNKWVNLAQMPKQLSRLYENGDLHYHDLDSFNLTTNCLHIPTRKMLNNGFNTGYGTLRPAKRLESASELSCIILQSTQNK